MFVVLFLVYNQSGLCLEWGFTVFLEKSVIPSFGQDVLYTNMTVQED